MIPVVDRFPRIRGDEPDALSPAYFYDAFSPHTRG